MALLNSEFSPLERDAPDFDLTSVDGQTYSLRSFPDKQVIIVMFICAHCPYVLAVEDRIIALQRYFEDKPVQLVGICSNDSTDYPEDEPKQLLKRWKEKDYRFPYLIDETQEVAKAYGVVCTPEFFVLDSYKRILYHGQLDDNWKEAAKVKSEDLKIAVEDILNGYNPNALQQPSMGCSIKWRREK